jgi:hypothetical protein
MKKIKREDIINRNYQDKTCISFDYILRNDLGDPESEKDYLLMFRRKKLDPDEMPIWKMTLMIERTDYKSPDVYEMEFQMRARNSSQEMIIGVGLTFLKNYFSYEVNEKGDLISIISELIDNMKDRVQ